MYTAPSHTGMYTAPCIQQTERRVSFPMCVHNQAYCFLSFLFIRLNLKTRPGQSSDHDEESTEVPSPTKTASTVPRTLNQKGHVLKVLHADDAGRYVLVANSSNKVSPKTVYGRDLEIV